MKDNIFSVGEVYATRFNPDGHSARYLNTKKIYAKIPDDSPDSCPAVVHGASRSVYYPVKAWGLRADEECTPTNFELAVEGNAGFFCLVQDCAYLRAYDEKGYPLPGSQNWEFYMIREKREKNKSSYTVYAVVPDSAQRLSPYVRKNGKYKVIGWDNPEQGFYFIDEKGVKRFCYIFGSVDIGKNDWEFVIE